MKTLDLRPHIILCILCAAILLAAPATAAEIDGAWANDQSVCAKIFVKKDKTVSMARDSDNYGSGFIIQGDRIRGKMVTCTIKSRKEEAPLIHLVASCSTDVALQTVQFSLKPEGAKLTRVFPGLPELSMAYVRCPM